jgi:hypothetical protein
MVKAPQSYMSNKNHTWRIHILAKYIFDQFCFKEDLSFDIIV